MRDDFSRRSVEALAKRVGYLCSNPLCRSPTSGPHSQPSRSVNVGVAAHISAASPGGPRYDLALTPEQRRSVENGIWLCQTCAKLVDSDEEKYTGDLLRTWKEQSEAAISQEIQSRSRRDARGSHDPAEGHSIRFAVDEWKLWYEPGNRPGDVLVIIGRWAAGDICYSCTIRLRNDTDYEEQLHRLRIEFRQGEQVLLSDGDAFDEDGIVLPPRRWVSQDVTHGLHDDSIIAISDSVWFTAQKIGGNEVLAWRLADLKQHEART